MRTTSRARDLLLPSALTALAVTLSACRPGGADEAAGGWSGRVLPEPLAKPDFTFTDVTGEPFDFRRDTEGSPTLLFFGYTHCPDVCPVHMSNIAAVLRDLPGEQSRRLKVVFVTTDPERDTPERLREWLGAIHPAFIGLRGPLDEVHAAEEALMLPRSVVETASHGGGAGGGAAGSEGEHGEGAAAADTADYFVGHASAVVAFGADGLARVMYGWGTRQQDWRKDLPRLIAGSGDADGP
jgi:protein SCO1/2